MRKAREYLFILGVVLCVVACILYIVDLALSDYRLNPFTNQYEWVAPARPGRQFQLQVNPYTNQYEWTWEERRVPDGQFDYWPFGSEPHQQRPTDPFESPVW